MVDTPIPFIEVIYYWRQIILPELSRKRILDKLVLKTKWVSLKKDAPKNKSEAAPEEITVKVLVMLINIYVFLTFIKALVSFV